MERWPDYSGLKNSNKVAVIERCLTIEVNNNVCIGCFMTVSTGISECIHYIYDVGIVTNRQTDRQTGGREGGREGGRCTNRLKRKNSFCTSSDTLKTNRLLHSCQLHQNRRGSTDILTSAPKLHRFYYHTDFALT